MASQSSSATRRCVQPRFESWFTRSIHPYHCSSWSDTHTGSTLTLWRRPMVGEIIHLEVEVSLTLTVGTKGQREASSLLWSPNQRNARCLWQTTTPDTCGKGRPGTSSR